MAKVPDTFEKAWGSPEPSPMVEIERLRGETNTQYAELRGEMNMGFERTEKSIAVLSTHVVNLRWIIGMIVTVILALGLLAARFLLPGTGGGGE